MDTGRIITVNMKLEFTKRYAFLVLSAFLLVCQARILGSETLTLTTYYPAPYGAYVAILTTNQTLLARDGGKVGIGTKTPQAKLDVWATDPPGVNDGFLPPRMTSAGRISLSAQWTTAAVQVSKKGLLVYDSESAQLYTWDGSEWRVVGGGGSEWKEVDTRDTTSKFNVDCEYHWVVPGATVVDGVAEERGYYADNVQPSYVYSSVLSITWNSKWRLDGGGTTAPTVLRMHENCPSWTAGIALP